jgi:hypothetical protein
MTETEQQVTINSSGDKVWHNQAGEIHREDGPAMIYADGAESWWQNNLRHREDGPAVINNYGDKFWYIHGKLHRLTGPAIITGNNTRIWYINDRLVTNEVNTWMTENNTSWPWDEQTQAEFVLRWG